MVAEGGNVESNLFIFENGSSKNDNNCKYRFIVSDELVRGEIIMLLLIFYYITRINFIF
jgi:hypothetical protein